MNPEMEMHYSLMDTLEMAGWSAGPLVLSTLGLVALGLVLVIKRPSLNGRWGYMVGASLPLLIGITGAATGMMTAFSTVGARGLVDMSRFFAAVGEVALPFSIGLFCSALVMTLALLIWMRSPKPGKP